MTTIQERRLALFVDRTAEMRAFCGMLETSNKPIMVVWGDSGIGKSSLLARMVHECAQRKIKKSEVVFTGIRNSYYLEIMRTIRDDLGPEGADYFKTFNDLVNFFTIPHYELKISYEGGPISVAQGMKSKDSSIGDVAGIMIKDLMVSAPRPDMAVPEAERMVRLTDGFIKALFAATEDCELVIFFDEVDKMSPDTEKWVRGELLGAAANGRLPNVRFVLFGEKKPEFDEWFLLVEEAHLEPLGREHVIEYLARRGVEENERGTVADVFLALTGGKASDIANHVEAYLRFKQRREQAYEQPAR